MTTILETLADADPLFGQQHLALIRTVLPDHDALDLIQVFARRLPDPDAPVGDGFTVIGIVAEAAAFIGARHPGLPLNDTIAPAGTIAHFALRARDLALAGP